MNNDLNTIITIYAMLAGILTVALVYLEIDRYTYTYHEGDIYVWEGRGKEQSLINTGKVLRYHKKQGFWEMKGRGEWTQIAKDQIIQHGDNMTVRICI